MKKAMIITVGTGIGSDPDRVKSLASGIDKSIKNGNPQYIKFITSKEGEGTIKEIKELNKDIPENDIFFLKTIEDINEIYEEINNVVIELMNKNYESISIDFTSGTKAMSVGAVLSATKFNLNLSYISGERVNGKVAKGLEKIIFVSPTKPVIDIKLIIIQKLWDFYQYKGCLELIKELKNYTPSNNIIDQYNTLTLAYSEWDKFNHTEAYNLLRGFKTDLIDTSNNKTFLGKIINENNEEKEKMMICDLINNAKRRINEGKFDDAVARLYHTMEYIAQYKLINSYGIDSSDVDIKKLENLGLSNLDNYKKLGDNGKIKIGLTTDFQLLKDIGDEMGHKFFQDQELQTLLSKRNSSILAHGKNPMSEEDANKLLTKIESYASSIIKKYKEYIEESTFPKMTNINLIRL
ncbi:MAG: TIGR02710 family CRISPR-associated CARF protein [Thermoplasmata archaeon]